jgi:hypothetical protein
MTFGRPFLPSKNRIKQLPRWRVEQDGKETFLNNAIFTKNHSDEY